MNLLTMMLINDILGVNINLRGNGGLPDFVPVYQPDSFVEQTEHDRERLAKAELRRTMRATNRRFNQAKSRHGKDIS